MLANVFGVDSLYVLIIAVVVLFGGSQLPKLARNAGEAMKEFRKAHNEATSPISTPSPTTAPAAPAASTAPVGAPVVPPPAALPPVAVAPSNPAPAASPDERVTLTRSELDALLADREARSRTSQGHSDPQN